MKYIRFTFIISIFSLWIVHYAQAYDNSYFDYRISKMIKYAQEEIIIYMPLNDELFFDFIETQLINYAPKNISIKLYLNVNMVDNLVKTDFSLYKKLLSSGIKLFVYRSRQTQHDKRIFIDQKYVIEGKYLTVGTRSLADVNIIDSANLSIAYLDSFRASITSESEITATTADMARDKDNEDDTDPDPSLNDDLQDNSSGFTYHIHSSAVVPFPKSVIKNKELIKEIIKNNEKDLTIIYLDLLSHAYQNKKLSFSADINKLKRADISSVDYINYLTGKIIDFDWLEKIEHNGRVLFIKLKLKENDFFYVNKIELDRAIKEKKVDKLIITLIRSFLAESGQPLTELDPKSFENQFPVKYKKLFI